MERLHDGHNYCAVLRTMEALGVRHVWAVKPPAMESNNSIRRRNAVEMVRKATNTRTRRRAQERVDAIWEEDAEEDRQHAAAAARAAQRLSVREFDTSAACIDALRGAGLAIWATALEQRADVLAPGAPWLSALPPRVALVMGGEEAGVSRAFKEAADRLVYLPLSGFAESLNVSVAAALMAQLTLQLLAAAHPADQ